MNILDKAIAWFSPQAAYKRMAYRDALELQRAYDAANYKGANQNWHAFNESAEMEISPSRELIRARARDLENNSDIMNSILGAYKRNVFGAGYKLRATSEEKNINQELEKLWVKWCEARNCDVTGTQSLSQMLRMAIQRKKVDGGILILKRYTGEGVLPLQLQAIEVDELDTMQMTAHYEGNRVVGGVEYNRWNRPVGYHIRTYAIDGYSPGESEYFDAKDMIFLFTKRRPSQAREVSDMAPTLTRIRDANEFLNTISIKERVLACLSVFITQEQPQSGIGARQNKSFDGVNYNYQGKTLVPGIIQYLNPGDKVATVQPTGQAVDATAFTKQQMRMIGSGQGLSYEVTSRDMSESNYSSARQGIIEDELTYQEDVESVIALLDEIYESFVISAVLSEKVKIPTFWKDKDAYLSHKWIKAPKKWIDPVKVANANRVALQTGEKTYADLASERGRDWREQIDEMAEIREYAMEKGVVIGGTGNDKN